VTHGAERQYYENPALWAPQRYLGLPAERARLTIKWLPQDVESVLDIGCGNGLLTNQLQSIPRVVGLDRSLAALSGVEKPRCQADIAYLPFKDNSFDVAIATEVIEHLPFATLKSALAEIARVAKRYLLVTVPCRENLELRQVRCPVCRCLFNPDFHMRSFDLSDIENLFSGHRGVSLIKAEPIFPSRMPLFYEQLRRILRSGKAELPPHSICPQCGYSRTRSQEQGIRDVEQSLGRSLKRAVRLVWPTQRWYHWWIALYVKDQV